MVLFSHISLHKLLINPDKTGRSINVDHWDGNKLNNQKGNLRVCSHAENMRNRKPSEGGTSIYKGVYWNKREKRWKVKLKYNSKTIYLGNFTHEIAAANCYNYWALHYFGEYAQLNDCPYMSKEEWDKECSKNQKTSMYRGVSFIEGKYVAQIWNGVRNLVLGRFDNEEDAAIAYDRKAIELKGNKAKLNVLQHT
jgi:hypothetical protein